ncbi:MAG: Uma2 family endonuclease [Spirulinaceae cyanobacterium]
MLNSLVDIRRLTVSEYHQLGKIGILEPDEEVELVGGQILNKPVKNPPHSAANKRVEKLLERCLGEQVLIRTQEPVRLDNYSEPEPDLAIVKPDPFYYEEHHPVPEEVFLLVEISDTTLKRDREYKGLAYARSGIRDYWILDINERKLLVLRQPTLEGYQEELCLTAAESISPLTFPEVSIEIRQMFS